MLKLMVMVHLSALELAGRVRNRLAEERGQSTAEYALVLLGAAGVAMLLVAWATKTGKIGTLLNSVLDRVLSKSS